MPNLPLLFIGSSTEGLSIAQTIKRTLDNSNNVQAEIWSRGLFPPGELVPDRLRKIAMQFDFAILVFSPDEIIFSREKIVTAPRDNIVFELGLFTGALGRERSFVLVNEDDRLKLPTDFNGVTYCTYSMIDTAGGKIPDTARACEEILATVTNQGRLRHPRLEPDFQSIEQNFRRAFKLEHPIFQNRFENWFTSEKEESGVWGQGLLRISSDYGGFLSEAFRAAESNIFSTSSPLNREIWDKRLGQMLLRAQKNNPRGAKSTRVFTYGGEEPTPDDIRIMKMHQEGYKVRAFVYHSEVFPGFKSNPRDVENQWDMIDDGRAIGVTKSIGPDERMAYWYFDDSEKGSQYRRLRDTLLRDALPLDEWLTQSPRAA
jgi:hypothetical protein